MSAYRQMFLVIFETPIMLRVLMRVDMSCFHLEEEVHPDDAQLLGVT